METKPSNGLSNISPEVERMLLKQAAAAGVTPEEYLKRLLGVSDGAPPSSVAAGLSLAVATTEDRLKVFNAWAASQDPSIPALTVEDVSRDSIYD